MHGPVVFDRLKAGKQGTLWYYETLSDELDTAVDTMKRLAAT